MKKFFIVKTEEGYVTCVTNDVYHVGSFDKEDAVKFPYDISYKEYKHICDDLHISGFKNVEFTLYFIQ